MNEMRRFGITHFEEHTGLPASIVNQIKKGFNQIDYEMDELLCKFSDGWVLDEEINHIPNNFLVPQDIKEHIDLELPLLARQIRRLKDQINEFLLKQELQRPPLIEEATEEVSFGSYEGQVSFELNDFNHEPIGDTHTEKSLGSTLPPILKNEIIRYLSTVSSARIICELLIKNHVVSNERYITGKPKIYPNVCKYLDSLASNGIVRLKEKQSQIDRLYQKI